MNILLISECDKQALTQTRRILDQFAQRMGERTWQTPITRDGLDTLRRLLRQTARKNTAVACHWIRGLDHSELLWVVGDRSRFNPQGAVPTNTTARNILRQNDENDWHTGQDIHLLTALAALLHDVGKASQAFQMRLTGQISERNQYRHEWVSLRLFEAFVGQDDDATWLARLANPTPQDDATWLSRLKRDGLDAVLPPFQNLIHAPLAQAIGWLMLTHHRLPVAPAKDTESHGHVLGHKVGWINAAALNQVLLHIDAGWNECTAGGEAKLLPLYWTFKHGLPVTTDLWRKHSAKLAQRLLVLCNQPGKGEWLANPYVMHISRLCLMLSDHHYSSLGCDDANQPVEGRVQGVPASPLWANNTGKGKPNQTLAEHLLGVAQHSSTITYALPKFETHLPRLGDCKALKKRSNTEGFHWQNKAADKATSLRERALQNGAFIVNMASTGCGKTLANARIMYGLADPNMGMRCAFAMGLRTLTLQTGRAFRDLLGLSDDELAIRVGGSASRALFEHYEQIAEQCGSASRQAMLEEDSHMVFEGNDAHPLLSRVMHDPNVRKLLVAPLLVCTIDHLIPATESQRGGRQMAPMLRLMSSDLVLDEPDDFDMADLPALTRLVHWAGLLGSRVLLSSATLPPALVQGLFEAYQNGRQHFARNRNQRPEAAAKMPEVCCLWVDEFNQHHQDCAEAKTFSQAHQDFAMKRVKELAQVKVRRRGKLIRLQVSGSLNDHPDHFARLARDAAIKLHSQHHSPDPRSGKLVSFGLIRMANIEPLVNVALALYQQGAPEGYYIHLCTYHSQFPLLIRSAIEHQLDQALNRRQFEAVFDLPAIRQRIDAHTEADHLFIVLGSPVTEVGRDHDYDWAVVEPSSMRSLIQLAGRIRRHRSGECVEPNLWVFDTNLRHFKNNDKTKPAFCKPGFETEKKWKLDAHELVVLLPKDEYSVMDSRPRVMARPVLKPATSLVDLEHARMQATMLPITPAPADSPSLNAASWWHLPAADALLTGVLPQQQAFRSDPIHRVDLVLRLNEDGDDYEMAGLFEKTKGQKVWTSAQFLLDRIHDASVQGTGITAWGQTDYMQALTELATDMGMAPDVCAKRFGTVTLPENTNGWRFHPALGFTKAKG
jgi:CRISPR-associated endonuclease/helicase Cas3